ncbi:hypothetical protein HAX54_045729 [Datura stramonium]|uniref:Uncharacterized protein n=1 Tax=Datura stramonium TaxID=4076 RepID=A0ABS8SR50_DATST|nr:hypothetical protein [Datura stramonium]
MRLFSVLYLRRCRGVSGGCRSATGGSWEWRWCDGEEKKRKEEGMAGWFGGEGDFSRKRGKKREAEAAASPEKTGMRRRLLVVCGTSGSPEIELRHHC